MKRDYSLIDPKIQPLVDALNGIAGVRTIASCEGHFSRISRPYVYFHCPPALAESIAARLHDLVMADALHHWWYLTGCFNGEHELCFSLEAPGLDHDRGLFKTFLNYVVFRKRIDSDLNVLSETFKRLGEHPGLVDDIQAQADADGNQQVDHHAPAFPSGNAAERVWFAATGTGAGNIGRHNYLAIVTSGHLLAFLRHVCLNAWSLARSLAVVALLSVTLSACAGNREIQHEGTGTDEMLKSPCACLPVPYDAPGFTWGRV